MSSTTDKLISKGLINPPGFFKSNIHYEVMTGSIAYGCSNDMSDIDIIGVVIPPKDIIFPHLKGVIHGFDAVEKRFIGEQMHHIYDADDRKKYDLAIYNFIDYFRLLMDNNPNIIDSLFVPRRCVLHSTRIGEMIRKNRKMFLHKGSTVKFKSYAFSQLKKIRDKHLVKFVEFCKLHNIPTSVTIKDLDSLDLKSLDKGYLKGILKKVDTHNRSKRLVLIEKHGYDIQFAYHLLRLLNEAEQILTKHDLDLTENREQLKSVRRGEWTLEQIEKYFFDKEAQLEELHLTSKLPYSPDVEAIKSLLLNCLEEHFGSLDKAIVTDSRIVDAMRQIQKIADTTLRYIK